MSLGEVSSWRCHWQAQFGRARMAPITRDINGGLVRRATDPTQVWLIYSQ